MRLDEYLVNSKKVASRNQASNLIKNGLILVNHQKIWQSSKQVLSTDVIEIIENTSYVSRGAYKLLAALKAFDINVNDNVVLDIGASTGGFSDVCLKANAKLIYCIDVGQNQLHPKIANDSRVINYEQVNIKDLSNVFIKHQIDLVVSDLSFISSKYMFKAIEKLSLSPNVNIISLIKPQFELTPTILAKHQGVVKDDKYHKIAIEKVINYAKQSHFKVIKIIDSPISGAKKGNKEFLMWVQYE